MPLVLDPQGWGVCWEGTRLGMCSHSLPFLQAAQRRLWTYLLSRQAFPLSVTSMNRHSILLATPAQPLSHLWFCVCLFSDSWSNVTKSSQLYLSKVFPISFCSFPFPCYQSGFNDLLFSIQKLPPNLNFIVFTLFSSILYPATRWKILKYRLCHRPLSQLKHIQFSS